MNAPIKLYKAYEISNEKIGFQSQLYVGRDTVDFLMEDGIMKYYRNGENGFNFYPYNEPYEIVLNKSEMSIQIL